MPDNFISLAGTQALDPVHRARWMSQLADRFGMDSTLHESGVLDCKVQSRQLDQLLIIDITMPCHTVSPNSNEGACWSGDDLFLKVITRGSITIEQNGIRRTFGERSILVVDPLRPYHEYFDESSSLLVLRIPKLALRDRGIPHRFHNIHAGDSNSPDVMAVCDFVRLLATDRWAISDSLGKRMADQCLDLLDVVISTESKSGRKRTGATSVVLRAKQIVHRLARNPNVDLSRIARELNVSPNYLARAFRLSGETPMRYLISHRLHLASSLLTENRFAVKEVALSCGFISSSHFCSAFKRAYGISPSLFAATKGMTKPTT
jgi:AraC-like DNA-binding protein